MPKLKLNCIDINQAKTTKFLGVLLDECLTWVPHINEIETKISRSLGLMYRIRSYLNLESRKSLYFSLIQSHLSYGNLIWGSTFDKNLDKLTNLQKRFCKALAFKRRYESAIPIMEENNILSIKHINKFQTLIFIFHHKNLWTHRSPRNYLSQIDFILYRKRWRNSFKKYKRILPQTQSEAITALLQLT